MIHRIDRHIDKLVALELKQTRDEYEVFFNSPHEGFALAMEEFCETNKEHIALLSAMETFWEDVMDECVDTENLLDALKYAKNIASEAIQTAAMIEKYMDSAEEKGW